jgi:Mn-containing catalase
MIDQIIAELEVLSYRLQISEDALRFLVDELIEVSDDPVRLSTLAFLLESAVSCTFSYRDNLDSVLFVLQKHEQHLSSECRCIHD